MKGRKKTGQNILHYVIASNVVIVFIIAILGGYLFRFYYKKMQEDFYKENSVYIGNIAKTHGNELQILQDISMQIALSDSARFLLDEQPTKSAALKKQLNQYRSVNQFFDVMYCFYQKDQYLFNHMTSISIDLFCDTAYRLENYNPEELKELLCTTQKKLMVLSEETVEGELVYFYDVQARNVIYIYPVAPKYDTILIFFIGADHYDDLFADEQGNQRNTWLIYNGKVVAESESEEIDDELLLSQIGDENEQKQVKIEGKNYLLTKETDDVGFSYVAVQPMNVFTDRLRIHLWGIGVLIILCCVPTFLLIGILSSRVLGGVKNINRMLSSEGEETYDLGKIEVGIRQLVNSSEDMKQDQMSLRKSRFIRSFLQSKYTALEILRRDAADAEINISYGLQMVGVIGSSASGNEEKIFEQILEFIQKQENLEGYGIHLVNTNQRVMVLFGESEENLYQAFDKILRIGRVHCDEFVVAVSWAHRSLLNGSLAYLEANTAYDSRFLVDSSQIIRFTEIGQNSSVSNYQNLRSRYMVQLENTIRVGNEQEVEKAIHDLCKKLEEEHATLLTFRLLYDEVLRFLMDQWNGDEKDWNQVYNVFTLSRCLTMEDFTSLLTEACHMILDTKTDVKNHQSELVVKAMEIMQKTYSDPDLNMASLADQLGISPVTLAVEFKNETGISPSDYLAVVRLERAKELLRTTDQLVKQVSEAVGYEDDHVFIRRFKKYTGKTPGQYRKDSQQ